VDEIAILNPTKLVNYCYMLTPVTKRFPFPNPVNETSARLVAAGVVLMSCTYLLTSWSWILIPLTYGFTARVAAGPTFSPLAIFATRVVTPRLKTSHKFVPGPPKRFAQSIGFLFSATASVLTLLDFGAAAQIVIVGLVAAAVLESVFAVCLGCIIFGWLMKVGVIPDSVCEACNHLSFGIFTEEPAQLQGR
jgi:hypothetical protein